MYTCTMVIYFSGIGGVAIGPLAEIAADVGHTVVGSDMSSSLVTDRLEKRGIKVIFEQTTESIAEVHKNLHVDLFVYTAALPKDHPELVFVKQHGIKTSKMTTAEKTICRIRPHC